jgi:serine/threonine protein kinase
MLYSNKAASAHQLKDFQLVRTLGTGTFGRVYLCQHKSSEFFAMKVLRKLEIVRLKQSNYLLTIVEHIQSEKAILEDVNHPFIVNLIRTYQDIDNVYMLEEY